MPDAVLERLLDLLSRQTGRRREKLDPDVQIQRDLGCSGEDAVELMEVYGKEFSVDLTGFEFRRHFTPEWPELTVREAILLLVTAAGAIGVGFYVARLSPPPWVFVLIAIGWLGMVTLYRRPRQRRLTPLTPRDLVRAARTGRWVSPEDH